MSILAKAAELVQKKIGGNWNEQTFQRSNLINFAIGDEDNVSAFISGVIEENKARIAMLVVDEEEKNETEIEGTIAILILQFVKIAFGKKLDVIAEVPNDKNLIKIYENCKFGKLEETVEKVIMVRER